MASSFLMPANLFTGRARDLLPDEKLLLACFWCSPFQTACGVFSLHEGMMAEYSSVKPAAIIQFVRRASKQGEELLEFDEKTNEVFVRDWWRVHKCRTSQQKRIVLAALNGIRSDRLKKRCLEELKNNGFDLNVEKSMSSSLTSTSTSTSTSTNEQEAAPDKPAAEVTAMGLAAVLKEYPASRRGDPREVEKIWRELELEQQWSVVLDAVKSYAVCDEWRKDEGRFVPGLGKFLRERRFEAAPRVRPGYGFDQARVSNGNNAHFL